MADVAIKNGFNVIGIQRPLPKHRNKQIIFRLKELNIFDKVKFEVLDLTKKNNTDYLFKNYNPTYFAHLASQSSVLKSMKYKKLTREENEVISDNLIDSMLSKSMDTKMFFPSSATIFEGYKNKLVDELTSPKPLTTYSKTKHRTQERILELITEDNLLASVGIMFSHESEFRRSNFFSKIITEFLVDYKFKKRRKLTVGNISLERDIGYAKEYTEAIFKILSTGKNSKYIVSANRLSSLEDFIINCLNLLDIKYERISSKDSLSFVSKDTGKVFLSSNKSNYREIDLYGIQGNNSKIKKDTGWIPKLTLDQICSKMISYDIRKAEKL